jgi:hypothetical protein
LEDVGGLQEIAYKVTRASFRQNVKPQTFEIAEINFGNFLGCFTTIQKRSEAILSKKGKSEATLYKTPLCHEISPRFFWQEQIKTRYVTFSI